MPQEMIALKGNTEVLAFPKDAKILYLQSFRDGEGTDTSRCTILFNPNPADNEVEVHGYVDAPVVEILKQLQIIGHSNVLTVGPPTVNAESADTTAYKAEPTKKKPARKKASKKSVPVPESGETLDDETRLKNIEDAKAAVAAEKAEAEAVEEKEEKPAAKVEDEKPAVEDAPAPEETEEEDAAAESMPNLGEELTLEDLRKEANLGLQKIAKQTSVAEAQKLIKSVVEGKSRLGQFDEDEVKLLLEKIEEAIND